MTAHQVAATAIARLGNTAGPRFLADITAQSGQSLQKVVLGVGGTFLVIVMVFKALQAYAEDKYGKLATLLLAGSVVAFFVYMPDQAVGVMKSIAHTFAGGT